MSRPLLVCAVALLAAACTRVVEGAAAPASGPLGGPSGVDVDAILLDQSRMRAITGAGNDLTIIPSMDGKQLVDLDSLAATVPAPCRFVYADTAAFGPDVEQFHKTTFQAPPKGALISEGAAGYRDAGAARRSFDTLVASVDDCAATSAGRLLVGEHSADEDSLRTRPGECGRDYRVKSMVLLEVTYCGFPESVPDIVMTNITAKVPG
ncbi:sensor domain-containing protein [Mycobacterium heckeshornense]|uniref:sensor domain-containing protein n=1 Tax=Mycobacterium heckeshornense TaxID=110505 RepID=UPI00194258A2|nr:sensor domain-containing protein [Mycobacterium heckeshornense]BCQ09950.1 sensor domain-containing protein [Mycobacterium heckeshornense]